MRKTFILTLFMMFCSITFGQNAAKINETGIEYATLTKAINAAQPGQTITFLRDINEVVSIKGEQLTIDGDNHTFSSKMTTAQSATVDVKIQNVNFNGASNYNINYAYAIHIVAGSSPKLLAIENCTATTYWTGFVQQSGGGTLTMKNVTVSNTNYGVKVDKGTTKLENVTITNKVLFPFLIQNEETSAIRNVTIKDSNLSNISTWTKGAGKTEYTFEGTNTVGDFKGVYQGQVYYSTDERYDTFYLKDLNSILIAPGGQYVYTRLPEGDHQCVIYEEGTYHHHNQMLVDGKYYDIVAKVAQDDETHNGDAGFAEGIFYKYFYEAIDASKEVGKIYVVANTVTRNDEYEDNYTRGKGSVINHDLTIEFNKFRHGFTQPVGSTGTVSNGFQILKGNNVTLQNGRMYVDKNYANNFYILIQNYANLTVDGMQLEGANLDKYSTTDGDSYVLSNNSGEVNIIGATNITANDAGDYAYAFDVCKYQSYDAPVVTVNTTGKIDGKIEVTESIRNNITIYGGTFVADYTNYCADGIVCNESFKAVAKPVAKIGEIEYATLQAAIDAADAGQTVKLIRNVTNGYGVKIDKDVTIDFAGFKYQLKKGVGSTSTETNGLQILKGNNVTIQNGTLEVNEFFKNYFYILVQNYANLTVDNMNLDGANLDKWSATDGDSYVLSNNSGKVNISGATNITANKEGDKAFAFDVCDKSAWGYEKPVVTITSTGMFDGYFEISEGLDENLHIKAGTYIKDVQEWCDGGYFASENVGEDTWTVNGPYVAKVKETGVYFATLQAAIDAATAGQTVEIVANPRSKFVVTGAGAVINKDITIDLGGNAYVIDKAVGSATTETLGLQILEGNDVTLQNGTLTSTKVVEGKEVKMLVQNYANLTVKNINLVDNTEHILYVLSNNSGNVEIGEYANIITDAVAFDVYDYTSAGYTAPVVTVAKNAGRIEGTIEVSPVIANNLTINGGIYSADYTDYCPDGLICVTNGEVFTVIDAPVAKIESETYPTLEAAVKAATKGQTITLIRDVRNGYGVKIEKDLTIDFAGFKYQLKKGVGSTGTETNGLQIMKGNTVVLQNGALEVNPIFKYYFYILVQNYTDLTVANMNLDGTNLDKWSETDGDSYVLSNNSGKVNISGATNITANKDGDLAFAFDVCDKSAWGYELPVVTITSTGMFDGKFEISTGLDEKLHIQGGTYIKDVQEWCDPQYFSFENAGEDTWTVRGPYVARIEDTYYATLPAAVEAAQEKDVVYLVCDAIGAGTVIDKDITIDFDGFTYTFNKTVGSEGTTTLGFQIKKNNDVVLQNGTLTSTEVVEGKEVKMLVQNYANLTVNNMNLVDETEHILYVLSNNSGTVSIEGKTNITTDAVAFDVCKYASYAEPVVTLNTTGTIAGAIEVSATLYIERAILAKDEYSYILMQENGELFHNGIEATIKKEYKATSEVVGDRNNWNTISTPVKGYSVVVDAEVLNPHDSDAACPGKHDLYWYDEATHYWRYVNGTVGDSEVEDDVESENGQVVLNSGQGYLYTNNRDVRFSFTGKLNTEAVEFPLSYTEGIVIPGFNMVGNPFTYNIGIENFKSEATLADGYYTITADGAWQARQEGAIIAPMQSVLIKTDKAATLTINPKANNTRKASNASLEIVAYNDQYEDVAYVSFGEGLGLDKIEHRNSDIPMVFVPVNGKEYAIATMSSDVKEIPVSFQAGTMGQYTIEVNAKDCEYSEMYLVDRLTGEVTDLINNDYTFIATTNDEANRFVIKFAEESATSTTDNFAFINNGEIIIDNVEGNGVVRIYDMLGRPVSQYDVTESARISTSAFAGGLYIIQMVDGNGVKVQKVVID